MSVPSDFFFTVSTTVVESGAVIEDYSAVLSDLDHRQGLVAANEEFIHLSNRTAAEIHELLSGLKVGGHQNAWQTIVALHCPLHQELGLPIPDRSPFTREQEDEMVMRFFHSPFREAYRNLLNKKISPRQAEAAMWDFRQRLIHDNPKDVRGLQWYITRNDDRVSEIAAKTGVNIPSGSLKDFWATPAGRTAAIQMAIGKIELQVGERQIDPASHDEFIYMDAKLPYIDDPGHKPLVVLEKIRLPHMSKAS